MQKENGASVRICNLAKGLVKIGHNVKIIIPKSKASHEKVDGLTVEGMRGFLPDSALRVLRKIVNVGRPTSLYFYDLFFIAKIIPFIREADVVQFEQQNSSGLLSPFIKYVLKKPVVMDCHDVFQALRLKNTSFLRRILETSLEKNAYKTADLILTVSDLEKRRLFSNGFHDKKIVVIPNGVDTKLFYRKLSEEKSIRKKYGLNGYRSVVFVGNLDYYPNREAVRVLSSYIAPKILGCLENVKFLVMGKTQEKLNFDKLVFTGFVKNLPDILSISDVAVVPLLQGSGTRLKILEYFSMGLPVVSTSVGAEGLDVKNGTNIFIEDNFDCFASRVVELLENGSLSYGIGRAAQDLAKSVYDWESITQDLSSVLTQLCVNND